mmetsp:Transcript_23788/g.94336  ORF Transcript_23788/g.94336 Transcript_23788/m.94336 type:complete len:89 (+) Transcript_23788:1652-1918(+)
MWLVPDAIERSFYRRFFAFYGVLLDYALADVRLAVLDVDARLRIERSPAAAHDDDDDLVDRDHHDDDDVSAVLVQDRGARAGALERLR